MRIYEYGGPEKLRWEQVQVGAPGEGQALVRNTAVGLNFVDTYQRNGLYQVFRSPRDRGAAVEAVG
jgi:NADPH2:quinone reductase